MSAAGLPRWASRGKAIEGLPRPQPPQVITVPALTEQRLANGLTIAVSERHDLPLVSVALMTRAGPEFDPPDRAGLAAMTATLLTKGARRGKTAVGAAAIAHQAEALGGAIDSTSTWRASTLAMTVATPKLPEALALLADLARRPTLAADELERARAQALDALKVTLGDPGEVAGMVVRRAWWGDSPYGASATPASVKRLALADVQRCHAMAWQPQRAALVLVGDITPQAAGALADSVLGDWRGGAAGAEPSSAAPQSAVPPLVRIDMPGSGQSAVMVAAPFVALGAPDRRIGQVASAVLGAGYSARLNQKVRIERGMSYGAGSLAESQRTGGIVIASAQTQHATAADVLALMREEILRMASAPPDADELAARQAVLTGAFARRMTTTAGLAGSIIDQYAKGRPLDEWRRFVDEVMAVRSEQVGDFARRYWSAGAVRAVVVGDLKAAGAALQNAPGLTVPIESLDLERAGLVAPG